MFKVRVAGVGSSIPQTCLGNAEIEARLGLKSGWIERRTGILSRPIAAKETATSDLAIEAGTRTLQAADVQPSNVGLLLLATSTPDHLLPPTAPLVAHRLGLVHAGAVDLAGACSGFLYALALGSSYAQTMQKPVLVIASNILSRRVNQNDLATVALFGDGAGAAVLVPSLQPHISGIHLGADGSNYDSIRIPVGGTREPLAGEGAPAGRQYMAMKKGGSLFRNASHRMAEAGQLAMLQANVRAQDLDWWIPHQANLRLIRDTGTLLGVPMDRTITVIDRYANSSSATIPIALAEAAGNGQIQRGHLLLLTAVGAGMTNAATVLRW
jgi:3-oxoacyl-[acyl-carrier-protein] synthase III